MGSFRFPGCFNCVRTDQRGWDLLDIMDVTTLYALTRGGGTLQTCWMSWLCTHWPEGVGSFRHHACYHLVRTDQRGWDLLDIMDVTTLYALTRGGGILQTCWMSWLCTHWPEGVGSFRLAGCYDFVRTDQRGWDFFRFPGCYDFVRADQRGSDLLDFMDVTTLCSLTRGGGIFQLSWM